MTKTSQQLRQLARREALSMVNAKRADRLAREKRLEALAVAVTEAMVQRRELEGVIGERLIEMTEVEGLPLREVVDWCGLLSVSEAQRLLAAATVRRTEVEDPPVSPAS